MYVTCTGNTTDATTGATALLLPAQSTVHCEKTPGGAGTHTGHTRDTRAGGRTRAHGSQRRTSQPSKPTNTQPARQRTGNTMCPVCVPAVSFYGTGKKTPGAAGTHASVVLHVTFTRDTRDTRTHKGTRTTQTNLTTIQTHQQHTVRYRTVPVKRGSPRCLFTGKTRPNLVLVRSKTLSTRARPRGKHTNARRAEHEGLAGPLQGKG